MLQFFSLISDDLGGGMTNLMLADQSESRILNREHQFQEGNVRLKCHVTISVSHNDSSCRRRRAWFFFSLTVMCITPLEASQVDLQALQNGLKMR